MMAEVYIPVIQYIGSGPSSPVEENVFIIPMLSLRACTKDQKQNRSPVSGLHNISLIFLCPSWLPSNSRNCHFLKHSEEVHNLQQNKHLWHLYIHTFIEMSMQATYPFFLLNCGQRLKLEGLKNREPLQF